MNPDAFSLFIRFHRAASPPTDQVREALLAERSADEETVRQATTRLLEQHIPDAARRLPELTRSLTGAERDEFFKHWIGVVIHFFGINLRWMGVLRNHVPTDSEA